MAHADAFADALEVASREGYSAVLVVISTPGGSVDAMLRIIERIDNSPVPVVAYVYPAGTTAWSAGTYILMASHVAAMAPNTVIGSCQPISYSPLGSAPVEDDKIINALVAVMSTHAESRNRNLTLARDFVVKNANVDDIEAYEYGAIEYRADSVARLLEAIDGRAVLLASGVVTLNTRGAAVDVYSMRPREAILNAISDPTVSSILFLVGLFALIYGFSAPGHGGEILGGIAILLALIGMGFDINVVSAVMMVIGAILLIYELATPGFGIFGISGVVILTFGALFLVPFSPEKWAVSGDWYSTFTYMIVAVGICVAALFLFAAIKVLQVRRRPPIVGTMIGDIVIPTENARPGEVIFVVYRGEYWQAKSAEGIVAGKKYRISGKEGVVLVLEESRP
ncbi:MAG: nodulation protein NfeD [Candidatus Methanosuratincola subterraneus]|uniref:Nodulation protein NfeD n=1 Tax=Methanosuratincola subterraneus TaxID=2593994 RepID=A0A3S3SSH4_METS7|nr:MAG: nodulation protein NfeD [Candidatus Methanosuratincola subterraneus]